MSVLPLHGFFFGAPVGRSILGSSGTVQTVQGTAYFCYLGLTLGEDTTPKFVEFYVTVGASGSQVAEVGLFSSVGAPNRLPVTLSKIVATGSVTPMNSPGVKSNITPFNVPIPSLVHLWAGFRCNTTGPVASKPQCQSLMNDWGYGLVVTMLAAPALTTAGPFVGTPFAAASFNGCPTLRTTLD